MPNWTKWLVTLLVGAGVGAGVVPQIVTPTAQNPTGVVLPTNPAPAQNPLGTILGALIGAGVMAGALKAQLETTESKDSGTKKQ